MPKTSSYSKQKESSSSAKNSASLTTSSNKKKRGWDEIESLFQEGKEKKKEQKQLEEKEAKARKERRKKRFQEEQKASSSSVKVDTNDGDTWVDDGLGGVYNSEGFTGRIEDGLKIFKAHILSKPGAGTTPKCPFDCDCCFI